MIYLIEDDKCIYNDNIVCKTPNCEKCDEYVNRHIKSTIKHTECTQLNIFDLINEGREEYAKKNNR